MTATPRLLSLITLSVALSIASPASRAATGESDRQHPAASPRNTSWMGSVSYVVDGDSLRIRPAAGGKPISVRLHGVEAPEICQPGGTASRQALKQRAGGQRVRVAGQARDVYGRLVAQVYLEGDDLGAWMVSRGHAWSYRYRGQGGVYAHQQALAQQAGRGLFGQAAAPMYPGDFRKSHGSCRV